ncbi:MAG: hypothetical protein ACPGWR_28130, partial [Ardenticatenaceae bacterium]
MKKQIKERFDDTARKSYRRLFESWGLSVETERSVFARSRAIDIVVECTAADRKRLKDTVFCNFSTFNAIELKGSEDPLTPADVNVIMMRVWGLGALELINEKDLPAREMALKRERLKYPSQRTVTIICVTRPVKILSSLRHVFHFLPTDKPGIYFCDQHLPRWIICPTELELIPANYPLLALATGEKLEQFMDLCIREGLDDYFQLAVEIGMTSEPQLVLHKILEVQQMKRLKLREDTWEVIDQLVFHEMPEGQQHMLSLQQLLAESKQQA